MTDLLFDLLRKQISTLHAEIEAIENALWKSKIHILKCEKCNCSLALYEYDLPETHGYGVCSNDCSYWDHIWCYDCCASDLICTDCIEEN
jgi:hypothetical protein